MWIRTLGLNHSNPIERILFYSKRPPEFTAGHLSGDQLLIVQDEYNQTLSFSSKDLIFDEIMLVEDYELALQVQRSIKDKMRKPS